MDFKHDESSSIIGKWKHVRFFVESWEFGGGFVDYSNHNVILEFTSDGYMTISGDIRPNTVLFLTNEYRYLFSDKWLNESKKGGVNFSDYRLILEWVDRDWSNDYFFMIFSDKLIIEPPGSDRNFHYFEKIN